MNIRFLALAHHLNVELVLLEHVAVYFFIENVFLLLLFLAPEVFGYFAGAHDCGGLENQIIKRRKVTVKELAAFVEVQRVKLGPFLVFEVRHLDVLLREEKLIRHTRCILDIDMLLLLLQELTVVRYHRKYLFVENAFYVLIEMHDNEALFSVPYAQPLVQKVLKKLILEHCG